MHWSRRRLLRRRLEFHVCTIYKSGHRKKSGKLFNDPPMCVRTKLSLRIYSTGNLNVLYQFYKLQSSSSLSSYIGFKRLVYLFKEINLSGLFNAKANVITRLVRTHLLWCRLITLKAHHYVVGWFGFFV